MLTLAHAWVLALLPLPLLVAWLVPPYRESREGIRVPFLDRLAALLGREASAGAVVLRGGWPRWLMLLVIWTAVVTAAARPQLIEPPITKTVPTRDMLLAVDLSGSMDTKDFTNANGDTVDRLTAVKDVLDDFLTKRVGDQVGLIFFGSAPFVQAPFTQDLKVCRQLLDEAQTKMAGPQTALGDAIGLAITMFDRSRMTDRVLIVLTDGNDTVSNVPPRKAAQIAKDKGILIHTVAVGDPRAAGESALDVDTLKNISTETGGIYSFAADRDQLARIYDQLDKLNTRPAETVSHRPRRDVYWWPLAAGLVLSFAWHAGQLVASLHRSRTERTPMAAAAPSPQTESTAA
jgi:Ca-activated chloride channel family protein